MTTGMGRLRRLGRPAVAAAGLALAAATIAGGCAVAPRGGATATTWGSALPADGSALPAVPTTPVLPAAPDPTAIQPIVVSTSLWPGRDVLLLALEDAANAPFGGPAVAVRVRVSPAGGEASATPAGTGPDTATASTGTAAVSVDARYVRLSAGGRSLYAVDAVFPTVGRWLVSVEATVGGRTFHGDATADVLDPGRTPVIGSAAPAVDMPTSASAGGDLALVTSDPIPDKRLYWLSVRQALDLRTPFVLVLDSFSFRTSPSCGGALGIVHHLVDEFPTVAFLHAEPYATASVSGRLALDPPGGPPRLAAWSTAWGISDAPWVFVVDGDGTVRAKFSGVVGTDELRAAIRSVAGWAPTY